MAREGMFDTGGPFRPRIVGSERLPPYEEANMINVIRGIPNPLGLPTYEQFITNTMPQPQPLPPLIRGRVDNVNRRNRRTRMTGRERAILAGKTTGGLGILAVLGGIIYFTVKSIKKSQ